MDNTIGKLQETVELRPVEAELPIIGQKKQESETLKRISNVVDAKQAILDGIVRGLSHTSNAEVNKTIETIRNQMKAELVDLKLQLQLVRLLAAVQGNKEQLIKILSGININVV
jgi:hypothetical protein